MCVWSGSSLSVVDAPIIEVGVLLEGGGVAFPSILGEEGKRLALHTTFPYGQPVLA